MIIKKDCEGRCDFMKGWKKGVFLLAWVFCILMSMMSANADAEEQEYSYVNVQYNYIVNAR